jgi:glutamyl-tRNA reductase
MNTLHVDQYYAAIVTYKMVGLEGLQKYFFKDIEGLYNKASILGYKMVVIQTCNRVEVYSYGFNPIKVLSKIGINRLFCKEARILRGADVLRHLICVVSGLDSLAVGENQVMGQVRKTYTYCKENGLLPEELECLFNEAFKTGRRVRSKIMFKVIDYARATIDIIKEEAARGNILLIGTGDMARDILSILTREIKYSRLYVAGRRGKSKRLTDKYGGEPVEVSELEKTLPLVNVIITCVSTKKPILTSEYSDLIQGGALVIDLGMPPNVSIDKDSVRIYSILDISEYIKKRYSNVKEHLDYLYAYIDEQVQEFRRRREDTVIEEIIRRIYNKAERIRKEEFEEATRELRKILGETKTLDEVLRVLNIFSWSLIKKLYHHHVDVFRRLRDQGQLDKATIELISRLYLLGDDEDEDNSG